MAARKFITKPKVRLPETFPDVFIIESLNATDEKMRRFEGQQLSDILRASGKNPKYIYFHEEKELDYIIPLFLQSQYRYLHFSCHGTKTKFDLRVGSIDFEKFSEKFGGSLAYRRLFFSACDAGNQDLVDAIHKHNEGAYSIVAPSVKIYFDHASIIWAALYTSMLDEDDGKTSHKSIIEKLKCLIKLFPISDIKNKTKMEFLFAGYDPTRRKWNSTPIKI